MLEFVGIEFKSRLDRFYDDVRLIVRSSLLCRIGLYIGEFFLSLVAKLTKFLLSLACVIP